MEVVSSPTELEQVLPHRIPFLFSIQAAVGFIDTGVVHRVEVYGKAAAKIPLQTIVTVKRKELVIRFRQFIGTITTYVADTGSAKLTGDICTEADDGRHIVHVKVADQVQPFSLTFEQLLKRHEELALSGEVVTQPSPVFGKHIIFDQRIMAIHLGEGVADIKVLNTPQLQLVSTLVQFPDIGKVQALDRGKVLCIPFNGIPLG